MLRHVGKQSGGIGTYTNEIVRHLLKADSENEYILFYQEKAQAGSFGVHPNVKEVTLRAPSKMIWDQVVMPFAAKRERCDVLFNLKLSVPFLSPCKTAFVIHGADWFMFPRNYPFLHRVYHKFFMMFYIKRADAVVSISTNATQLLLKAGLAPDKKIATIHHGVNGRFLAEPAAGHLERVRQRYNLPDRFILFVGQIYPMKNLSAIIRAFALLRGRLPHKLVIVGKPLSRYQDEFDLVEKLGLSSDITFTGWVPDEDLPAFYRLADLFLFPSLYEGFGIPLLEAMASGCPIVTSNAGACPEVVGDAALIADPRDDNAIADAVYRLVTDDSLRSDLRKKGLKRAQLFSWASAAQRTLTFLKNTAGVCASLTIGLLALLPCFLVHA
jgi:glycosyltransferase involved in cell wall biosynthesis